MRIENKYIIVRNDGKIIAHGFYESVNVETNHNIEQFDSLEDVPEETKQEIESLEI
jgi:hypothetical protein